MLGNELGRPDLNRRRQGDERRRGGRLTAEMLRCRMNGIGMGKVLDLSPCGMRLRSGMFVCLRRDAVLDVTLTCHDARLRVRGRVAWIRRVGLIRREIGLQFMNVDDQTGAKLRRMAALARQMAY